MLLCRPVHKLSTIVTVPDDGDREQEALEQDTRYVNHFTPNPTILSLSKDCFSFKQSRVRHEEKDSASTSSA